MPEDTPTDDTPTGSVWAVPTDDSATEQDVVPVDESDVTSTLAQIREARKTIGAGADPLDLEVPGYNHLLVIRYKWIPFKELSSSSQRLSKIQDVTDRSIAAAAETVTKTCQEILIRVDGTLKPLAQEGQPAQTFASPELGTVLGFPVQQSARENARAVFNNEYALIDAGAKIVTWLEDTSQQIGETTLGN